MLSVGEVLRVSVPEAFGGKTVIGQLTVDRAQASGFVTAYPCEGGLPGKDDGDITRSDLNFDGTISPVASNRLIVEADDQGDVCFYLLAGCDDHRRQCRVVRRWDHLDHESAHQHPGRTAP